MTTTRSQKQCRRFPAAELRIAPAEIRRNPRLEIVFFDAPADVLPNGRRRPDEIKAVAAFRVGGDFHGRARVEKGASGPVLSVETESFDLVLNRPEEMLHSLNLLSQLYAELGRRFVTERAKRQARKGRN